MKKVLGVAGSVALLAALAGTGHAQVELIQNGNLDAWTGSVPDNWDLTQVDDAGDPGGAAVIAEETTIVKSGSSMAITTGGGLTYRYVAHSNDWGAIPEASDWAVSINGDGTSRTRIFVARQTDGTGPWAIDFGISGATGIQVDGAPPAGWTDYTGTFPAGTFTGGANGTDRYRFSVHAIDDGPTYVDDVSLTWGITEVAEDFSGALDPAFGSVVISPPESGVGDVTNDPNFDYVNNTNPAVGTPPGGNGSGLFLAVNQVAASDCQIAFYTVGEETNTDYAIETMMLPYLSADNTGGGTTWGGVGIRVSDEASITGNMAAEGNFGSGYYIQVRTDTSGSFGSYANFYKAVNGTSVFLGRYYFEVGTGGVSNGVLPPPNESRTARDPEATGQNTWIPVRMEAVGARIRVFIDDLGTPLVDWVDPDPIPAGKAFLFHEDPFCGSLSAPADTVGTIFDRFSTEILSDPCVGGAPSLRTVDGVGTDPDTFATLSEALADLMASCDNGDGEVDTIEVTVDITEPGHLGFTFADEVVINGNSSTIVFADTAVYNGVVSNILNASGTSVTINDLVLLPEYDTGGGVVDFPGAALRVLDDGLPTDSASIVLNNVTITGSTVGDAAVDPLNPAPADVTRFTFGSAPIFAGGIRFDSTTGGTNNTVEINDSTVAHVGSRGIYASHQDGMSVTMTNVQARHIPSVGFRTFAMTGNWTLIDCISEDNTDGLVFASTGGGSTGALLNVSGGSFSNNDFYGIDLNSATTANFDGIQVIGNANRGIYIRLADVVVESLTNSVIADNGSYGIHIPNINTAASWAGGISGLILANNGPLAVTPSNFSYSAPHTGAVTITVSNSTFHNPGGDQGNAFIARNFDHGGGDDQTWEFVDCIFSGNSADDDVAFIVQAASNNITIDVSNSAIVTAGVHAIDLEEQDGGPANITQTDVINADPVYLSTTLGDADFLHVDSQCYAGAGSGGTDLAGGAVYVGGTICGTAVDEWMILNH